MPAEYTKQLNDDGVASVDADPNVTTEEATENDWAGDHWNDERKATSTESRASPEKRPENETGEAKSTCGRNKFAERLLLIPPCEKFAGIKIVRFEPAEKAPTTNVPGARRNPEPVPTMRDNPGAARATEDEAPNVREQDDRTSPETLTDDRK